MSRPNRYLAWMVVCVVAVLVLGIVLYGPLSAAFAVNPALNGGILAINRNRDAAFGRFVGFPLGARFGVPTAKQFDGLVQVAIGFRQRFLAAALCLAARC